MTSVNNMTRTPAEVFGEYKYLVPADATVPKGVEVLRVKADLSADICTIYLRRPRGRTPDHTYWTKEPIESPRPELPTEVGTALHGVEVDGVPDATTAVLTKNRDGAIPWMVSRKTGEYVFAAPRHILSWTLATAPDGTQTPGLAAKPRDVMDEADKSPVVDRDGDLWVWTDRTWRWEYREPECLVAVHSRASKADLAADYGPLGFAEEVQR